MSVQVISWALEFQDLPLDSRTGRPDSGCAFVLVALANHADRDGCNSFPSIETVCWYTKLSERTVQYKLRSLEEAGVIVRTPDPLIRSATIQHPGKQPTSWDIVAYGRGAKSTTYSPDQGCKVSDDFAPEPSLNRKSKHEPTSSEADASDSGADAPGTDAGAPCGGRDDSSALFDLGSDLTEDGGDDLGAVAGSTPSRSKKPRPGRRGVSTPDEEQGRIIRSLVGAWVEAFQANHPGLKPTKSQRGQVGRGVKELVLAGNPTDKIQSAAEYAGSGGIATVVNEFARIHSASNGRDRRIRRQDLPAEDWRRFVQE